MCRACPSGRRSGPAGTTLLRAGPPVRRASPALPPNANSTWLSSRLHNIQRGHRPCSTLGDSVPSCGRKRSRSCGLRQPASLPLHITSVQFRIDNRLTNAQCHPTSLTMCAGHYFSVTDWNILPSEVVDTTLICMFKARLD